MSGFRALSYTGRAGRNARRTCNQTKPTVVGLCETPLIPAGVFSERSNVHGIGKLARGAAPGDGAHRLFEEMVGNLVQGNIRRASTGGERLRSVSHVNKPERTALTLSRIQEQLLRKSLPDRKARPPPRPRPTADHRQARDQEQRPADQAIIADNVTTGGAARGNVASPALLAASSEIAAPILSETQLDAVGVGGTKSK